jgi:hypothetical protein
MLILRNRIKLFATGGTILTYLSYYQYMKDKSLLEQIDKFILKVANSNVKHPLGNLTKDNHKSSELLDNIIETLIYKNKFLGDSGDSIKEIINKWNEVLSTLSPTELGALTYLFSSVLILLCLITIMGIVYSDLLLNYFKLEEKYPKLGQYFKIRKMFQQYYLFINFMIIIITLLAIIFLNIQILFFF